MFLGFLCLCGKRRMMKETAETRKARERAQSTPLEKGADAISVHLAHRRYVERLLNSSRHG
jgi:hypothetical protein